jgi:hypothetical protein
MALLFDGSVDCDISAATLMAIAAEVMMKPFIPFSLGVWCCEYIDAGNLCHVPLVLVTLVPSGYLLVLVASKGKADQKRNTEKTKKQG